MSQVQILSPRPVVRWLESSIAAEVALGLELRQRQDNARRARLNDSSRLSRAVATRSKFLNVPTPGGRPRRGEARPGRIILSPRPVIRWLESFIAAEVALGLELRQRQDNARRARSHAPRHQSRTVATRFKFLNVPTPGGRPRRGEARPGRVILSPRLEVIRRHE